MYDIYLQKYNSFVVSLSQVDVITRLTSSLLENFPEKLPDSISEPYKQLFNRAIQYLLNLQPESEDFPITFEFDDSVDDIRPFFNLIMAQLNSKPDSNVDFHKAVAAQHIIMVFAHLDAFMGDSMRIICDIQPKVMANQRTITLENVILAGNWEALTEKLVDDFVSEFVKPNISSRIKFLITNIGLNIEISERDLTLLNEAENIRHIYVHNGGRVDSKFIKNTQRHDMEIGSEIQINQDYLDGVYNTAMNLGGSVFKSICEKFLNINTDKNPLPIWTTRKGFIPNAARQESRLRTPPTSP